MKLLFLAIAAMAAVSQADDSDIDKLFSNANNLFTARMFSEVVKDTRKSVVLSAYSVLTPLAQLCLASEGPTREELLNAIGLPNDTAIKQAFKLQNSRVRSVKGVELKLASRIFIPNNVTLNDNFAGVSRDVFNSDVKNVDFSKSEKAAAEINSWVESQTNSKIKDLVDAKDLDASTKAVLANAIYFKGKWVKQFDKDKTFETDFWVSNEKSVKVQMMQRKDDFLYGESKELDAKLLRMPYEGQESSMLIVLPNEKDGLSAVEEKLKDSAILQQAVQEMSQHEVEVFLPRFKIETTTNLKDILIRLNVTKIFDSSKAQLTNLLKDNNDLFVSQAVQKAFIEVNEEGAEAAAANEFGVTYLSAVMYESSVFRADRPFMFIIDNNDNTLFSGVYLS